MPLLLEDELLQAIRAQDVTAVQNLLENGADPNAGLVGADTSISIAVDTGNEQILDLLLHYRPFCCMKEEHTVNRPPQVTSTRSFIVRTLAYNFAVMVVTKYCLRNFATLAVDGPVGYVAFWTNHFHWFIVSSFYSAPESLAALGNRYRNPWWCVSILLDVVVGHQLYRWIDRRFLTITPVPWKSPGLVYDILVVLPLRFCLDALVMIGRETLTTLGILKRRRRIWIGDDTCFPRLEHWRSPAERVTRSITTSANVTEKMVLKLLHLDMLASKPYAESPVAAELLRVSLNCCWTQVTAFLLGDGALVDQNTSEIVSASRVWPWAAIAAEYCFPEEDCRYFPTPYFKNDYIAWPLWGRAGSFIELVQSSQFQSMATSQSHSDHDICTKMLYILQAHGADPLLTDSNGFDALSHAARFNCSANILRCLALFWKEARERLQCTDDAAMSESKALHQVTHTNFPGLEKMQILLDAGVSPQWEDSDGRTLLFAAAYMNRTTEAMNMLLKAGANPDNGGSKGYPPILRTLHDASLDKFMFFLDRGASPNAVHREGSSILQLVVEHETLAVIKSQAVSYLLERGAIVYDVATHVAPAFIAAARQPNSEGWDEVLLHDLLLRIPHIHRQRQLDIALKAACGSISTIWFGNFFTVFRLLSLGANPSVIDGGATALLQIVCWACKANDHDYKDDLLHLIRLYDPDLDRLDSAGISPLHHTIHNNLRDFSLVLLDFSANPDMVDSSGHTALQRLCSLDVPKYSIAKSFGEIEGTADDLRYAGVRGSADWHHNRRNIHINIKRSLDQEEIFQALVDHSANLMVLDLQGRSLLILASEKGNSVLTANILYRLGKERFNEVICTVDSNGQTAVHLAAANGNIDTLKTLLWPQNIMQASPNAWRQMAVNGEDNYQAKNSKSRAERHKERLEEQVNEYKGTLATVPSFLVANTAMMEHWEVNFTVGDNKRRDEENISLPNVSTSTWTLQKSDSISLRGESWHDTVGRTPLHYAAEKGHVEAIRLFLDHTDVDIDVEDRNGKKAEDLALDKNFYDVYSALKTREAEMRAFETPQSTPTRSTAPGTLGRCQEGRASPTRRRRRIGER